MSNRDKVAFAVFSIWITSGLYLDGWSHNVHKPETFFTPYHGLLYSGFLAAVLWGVYEARRQTDTPAPNDKLAMLGGVLFAVGGAADLVWHTVFGIEKDVAALLSPTHLTLMTGGILAASAPLRAARAGTAQDDRSLRHFLPVVLGLAVVAAVVAFFLQFASAFRLDVLPAKSQEMAQVYSVLAVLLTNAVLLGAAFYLRRFWTPPRGAFTLLFGLVAFAQTGLGSFSHIALVVPALIGGAVADRLADRPWLFGAAVPLALWGSWLAVFAALWGLHWEPEIWGGVLFFTALTGVGLAALTAPAASQASLVAERLEYLDLGRAQGGQARGGDHDGQRQGAGHRH
jgi:hypothetical protein